MSDDAISRTSRNRSSIKTLVTWSLGLGATTVLVLTTIICWDYVLERYYLNQLEEGSVEDRKEAAQKLAAMESQEGFERLLVLPPPEPPHLCERDHYTKVLIEHGNSAIPLFFEALQHSEVRVRYRAAAVFQKLHPPGGTRALVEALAHEDSQDVMINALAHQAPEPGEAIRALRVAIRSDSAFVRTGAAKAFGYAKFAKENLPQARHLLEQAIADPVPLVRIYSAWYLGDIGPRPESIPSLVAALDDEVTNVRRAAARALSILGADARPAREALERARDKYGGDTRKYAAEALTKIGASEKEATRGESP